MNQSKASAHVVQQVHSAGSTAILVHPSIVVGFSLLLLGATKLPDNVPVPQPRPQTPSNGQADNKAEQVPASEGKEKAAKPGEQNKEQPEIYVPPPIETEEPKALQSCLAALRRTGAKFRNESRIDDGTGCGIDKPVTVKSLGKGISLKPEGKMRCQTALQRARWTQGVVVPMLKIARPGETLTTLNQASTYICRKRNGTTMGKISEHARGNAADIAGFTFKSGKSFSIAPRMQDATLDGAFQRAITSAACLYFTTVLDPGSDAAHETHLHLDVVKRKGGYRYCW